MTKVYIQNSICVEKNLNEKKPKKAGPNIDLNNPSEWGRAIKQDAQGKNSLFERDLGNGQVLITHVFWVAD